MAAANENFLKAHYEWLVAGLGVAALVVSVVFLVTAFGESEEAAVSSCQAMLESEKPLHEGVKEADITVLNVATRLARTPPKLVEVDPKKECFLASERRVLCRNGDDSKTVAKACGRPIPSGLEVCPICGVKQVFVKVEVDTDHDGIPNDWEKKHGMNPNDPADAAKDSDGDGFTNFEEYQAKTDPNDAKDHPDYLDFLSVAGDLKETFLPFFFNGAMPIPDGKGGNTHRLTFQRLNVKSAYDSKFSVKVGEEIKSADGKIKTGFVAKSYTEKSELRAIGGSKTQAKKPVDTSFVEVERVSDGKLLKAVIGESKVPVEKQVVLDWSREGGRSITAFAGLEFTLHNTKYRVVKLQKGAQGCEVTVEEISTKKQKVIK